MSRVIGNNVLVVEQIPFLGKGAEDVATAVRIILGNNKTAQKLILEVGKPIILEKLVPKDDAPEEVLLSLHDMVRNHPMQEYGIDEDRSPFQNLWEMAQMIQGEGFEVSHLLLGDKFVFQKWVKIIIPITRMVFFNVPVKLLAELEADVFLLCGRDLSSQDEISFSMKATIP